MEKFEKYIKTAEFSELCHVSKQTLIYYDRIGLFSPHHVDGKGYRYYSLDQHYPFSLISMLVELNTPLKEIKAYLADKSIPVFLELLERKEQEAHEKIDKLEQIAHMIRYQKESIRHAEAIKDFDRVYIEREAEENLLVSKVLTANDDADFAQVVSEMSAYISSLEIQTFGFGAIVERKNLMGEFSYFISRFFVKTGSIHKDLFMKAEGPYAVTYHRGCYQTIPEAYLRILAYIERKGLSIVGDAFEEGLLHSFTQMKEEEFLTRISIPIAEA